MNHSTPPAQSLVQEDSRLQCKPFQPAQVRLLEGPFKEQQDIHARYLLQIEADRLLAPFREQAGLTLKAPAYGGWEARGVRGHTLGHYLSALALLYGATGAGVVQERVAYIIDEVAECQRANGDGYVLPADKNVFEQLRDGVVEATGFSLNGLWVPFYTLHKLFAGLRDAYRYCGNARALEIERQLGNWLHGLLSNLDAPQIQRMLTCEYGSMNEVLADLAADTGDAKFLEMASRCFHHDQVLNPMLRGEDKLNGLHANTQIPKVVGLAREWELTGEQSYRVAAESFWHNVVDDRSFVNGGNSESEHFFPVEQFPQKLTTQACETCNTYNMLKLTSHLFSWQPSAAQMDFVERALINHLLANIGRKEGEFGYFMNLGAVGVKAFSTPFDSWWCCVGTGLENPARYSEQIYAHCEDTLWINLYMGSTLSWPEKGLNIRQETRFPEEDTIRFSVQCEEPVEFELKLRHPSWCEQPEVHINGEPTTTSSKPSSYFSINRLWRSGDELTLRLPMALHLEALPHSEGKIYAAMFGPMVLAGIVPEQEGIVNPAQDRFSDHLNARGKTDAFPPLFVAGGAAEILAHLRPTGSFAEFRSEGVVKPADLTFVPFHRIYEEQYAVYLDRVSADEWLERKDQMFAEKARLARLEAATLDSVTPGYQQPEVEHGFQGENTTTDEFQHRKFRHAQDGWFSYQMKVDPAHPVALIATYWGSEWELICFDVFIDGTKIATQELHANQPGDFYDDSYPVPLNLTQGKTSVTVRFQTAKPGWRVGRLFGLKVMPADWT